MIVKVGNEIFNTEHFVCCTLTKVDDDEYLVRTSYMDKQSGTSYKTKSADSAVEFYNMFCNSLLEQTQGKNK